MAYKTDFLSQWNAVTTAVKVELKKELDYPGKIKLDKLNETYQLQTKKWSSEMMYEGNWLANIQNEKFSKEFLSALHGFHFSEVTLLSKRSVTGYLLSAAAGVASFLILGYAVHLGRLLSLGIGAVILVLGMAFSASVERKKAEEEKESIKAEYVKQLQTVEKTLAELCEKYDK